jgi:hypothetical protein
MSSIPNSAMPHAGTTNDSETKAGDESERKGRRASIKKGATKLKAKAKENPKTAIAAGAAVVAAAVGAAALGARKKSASAKDSGSKAGSKAANTKSDGRKSKSTP